MPAERLHLGYVGHGTFRSTGEVTGDILVEVNVTAESFERHIVSGFILAMTPRLQESLWEIGIASFTPTTINGQIVKL